MVQWLRGQPGCSPQPCAVVHGGLSKCGSNLMLEFQRITNSCRFSFGFSKQLSMPLILQLSHVARLAQQTWFPAPNHDGSAPPSSPYIGHHLVGHQLTVPLPAAAVLRSAPLVIPEGAVLHRPGMTRRGTCCGRCTQPAEACPALTPITGRHPDETAAHRELRARRAEAGRRLTVSSRVRKTT